MRGHSEAPFRLIQETFPLVVLEQHLQGADLQLMLLRMTCLEMCEPGYISCAPSISIGGGLVFAYGVP